MLSALKVITDRDEYSRFEPSRSKISVRVLPTPATNLPDETVTVSLKRRGVVHSQSIILSGDQSKGTVVVFDLNAIKDEDGYPLCIRGTYTVEASQGDITASKEVKVSLITATEFKNTYCFGLPLYASEVLKPIRQPSLITGVTIAGVSSKTRPGGKNLVFENNSLSWDGGPAVPLSDSRNEILPGSKGDYIEVEIDSFSLPSGPAAEGIVIDKNRIGDDELQGFISRATAEVENEYLQVFLEPSRVATEPFFSNPAEGEWFDYKVEPQPYYRDDWNNRQLGWHLNLPFGQPRRIDCVYGYLGDTRAMEIRNGAFAVNPKASLLDVLPYSSQYASLWTFFANMNLWGMREYIPNFWRYKGIAGIHVNDPAEYGDVLRLIGYTAAISVLSVAGTAARAGVSSESDSKDGISRSRSYGAAGAYGAAVTEYKDWVEKNRRTIRTRYRGISMVVV